MDGEPRILQNWIEIPALDRSIRNSGKGIGGQQNEQDKGRGNPGLHSQNGCGQIFRHAAREQGDQSAEQDEDENPQKHRAFVVSPHTGYLVDERLIRMGVFENIENRKVGCEIGPGQRDIGKRDKQALYDGCRWRNPDQASFTAQHAPKR